MTTELNLESANVLVTGGAGYIGSHVVLQLLNANCNVTVVDNFCNSSPKSLKTVETLKKGGGVLTVVAVDLCDKSELETVFSQSPKPFDSCIHFAGLKAVGESVKLPLKYYENNLCSTFNLLNLMEKYKCKKLVFSSSATVYGSSAPPLSESSQTGVGITNPYGQTKYMIEKVLEDCCVADSDLQVVTLRYFNPIGANESGKIGESPNGIPNNLMPYVQQVAVGKREKLTIFGDDYDTPDGTGVRDYIHVEDLAHGHLCALQKLQGEAKGCYHVFNLGTGNGYSVLQIVEGMKKASGKPIPYVVGPRREGDLAAVYATCDKAKEELGWEALKSIDDCCQDSWRWQSMNPNGFDDE